MPLLKEDVFGLEGIHPILPPLLNTLQSRSSSTYTIDVLSSSLRALWANLVTTPNIVQSSTFRLPSMHATKYWLGVQSDQKVI